MTGPEAGRRGPVRVSVPDEAWAGVVRGLFPVERVNVVVEGSEADAGASDVRSVEVRRDESGGFVLRFGAGVGEGPGARRLEGPGETISALELALTRALLRDHARRVQLHAAGTRVHGVGVLALGAAGAGKSSVALEWSRAGWPLLGDDVVLVDEDGSARAFPRLTKVDVERLPEHGIRPDETRAWVPGWDEAWVDPRDAGGWSTGACPVGLVVLLDRGEDESGDPLRAAELEPAAALKALLESVIPGGREGADAMDPLCRLLDGSRSLRLSYASSREAARFLVREAGRLGPANPKERMDG